MATSAPANAPSTNSTMTLPPVQQCQPLALPQAGRELRAVAAHERHEQISQLQKSHRVNETCNGNQAMARRKGVHILSMVH